MAPRLQQRERDLHLRLGAAGIVEIGLAWRTPELVALLLRVDRESVVRGEDVGIVALASANDCEEQLLLGELAVARIRREADLDDLLVRLRATVVLRERVAGCRKRLLQRRNRLSHVRIDRIGAE